MTPLRRPIAESTIGVFVSCGAQLSEDPPLLETEDITFRLFHRDTSLERLIVSHKTLVRKWAVEDLNVAYPIDRLKELEREGAFRRLAHTNVSMLGSIERYTELVEQTIPSIKTVYDSQGVVGPMALPVKQDVVLDFARVIAVCGKAIDEPATLREPIRLEVTLDAVGIPDRAIRIGLAVVQPLKLLGRRLMRGPIARRAIGLVAP